MKRSLMMVAAAVALLATACNKEKPAPATDGPIAFTTAIGAQKATRAYDATWEADDAIGIYLLKKANGTIAADTEKANAKHVASNPGGNFCVFKAASAADEIRVEANSTPVSFVAYYPYKATSTTHEYQVDVTTQSAQRDIDLLYSNNVTSYTTGNNPQLTFYHQLTKVVFNIKDERTGATLDNSTATLSGLNTKGVFNLSSGSMTSQNTVADIAANMVSRSGANATAEAIVIPGSPVTYTLKLTIPGDATPTSYTFVDQDYKAGQRHIYSLKIMDGSNAPSMILINGGSTITNWNDEVHPGDIIIDKNPGNSTSPSISVSANPAQVAATATSVSFAVSTTGTGAFSISGQPAWVTGGAISGSTVTLTVDANTDANPRSGSVTLNWGSASTTVTVSQAGATNTQPQPGTETVYYTETLGTGDYSSNKLAIADFTDWDVKTVTYGTSTGAGADIRSTSKMNAHIWFPNAGGKAGDNDFVISNLPAGYTKITLSYDVTSNGASDVAKAIQVFADDVDQTSKVGDISISRGTYTTVSIQIPDGTTKLRFYAPSSTHGGMRLDNISLKGTK